MTDERLKLLMGFAVVVLLTILAGCVALGKVEEHTSFGLQYILGALSPVPTLFAQWAFERRKPSSPDVGNGQKGEGA